jgi:hypothetical protein
MVESGIDPFTRPHQEIPRTVPFLKTCAAAREGRVVLSPNASVGDRRVFNEPLANLSPKSEYQFFQIESDKAELSSDYLLIWMVRPTGLEPVTL